jgi:hypothetical protein
MAAVDCAKPAAETVPARRGGYGAYQRGFFFGPENGLFYRTLAFGRPRAAKDILSNFSGSLSPEGG